MGLPTNVAIVTEGNTETTAEVVWDTTNPANGSYAPAVLTEQTVELNGTVTCPSNIDRNGLTLTTTIIVTISAAGTPTDPTPTDPTPSTPIYTIISGAEEEHELNADGTLTITCDGALDKLTEIYVDDKLVDAANYTLKSGSTILTFKAEYLNTLSVGTHKVKFRYNDGSVETTISIKQASTEDTTTEDTTTKDTTTEDTTTEDTTTEDTTTEDTTTQEPTPSSEKDDVPKTGDSAPIAWLFVIAIVNGANAIYFGRKKRGGH
jgi:hypothetical protein